MDPDGMFSDQHRMKGNFLYGGDGEDYHPNLKEDIRSLLSTIRSFFSKLFSKKTIKNK